MLDRILKCLHAAYGGPIVITDLVEAGEIVDDYYARKYFKEFER